MRQAALRPAAHQTVLAHRVARRTASSSGGTCRSARPRHPGRGRTSGRRDSVASRSSLEASRRGLLARLRRLGSTDSGGPQPRSSQHLVDALGEPLVPAGLRRPPAGRHARRGRSRSVRAIDSASRRDAPDLAQLPLDAVANDRVPDRFRHGEAETRFTRLGWPREPVEGQKPRRHRAAMPVDGVEVAGAREAVLALHAGTLTKPRDACAPWRGAASGSTRPARVDMRARKPCFRFRLRTFG